MSVEVIPSGCDVGAEIKGLDLTKPLLGEEVAAVERAFVEHTVLIFREQPLTDR